MLNKKTILAAALALMGTLPALAATEGKDYEVLPVEIAPLQKDKIEVTEFFAYWCPHCADLDPIILRHSKTFASDTAFRTEHVVWNEQRDFTYARLAAAVVQAGVKYQANPVIFHAVVDNRTNLTDEAEMKAWLAQQTAFDGKKVLAAFESFGNQAQAKQMAAWTDQYSIEGTPTVVVGGKYKVLFNTGYEAGMKTVDELIAKVREERGMKAPVPKAAATPVRSVGVRFVQSANR